MDPSRKLIALLAAASLLAAGCGDENRATSSVVDEDVPTTEVAAEPAFPLTVQADNGKVTVEAEPTAIVSLSPSITEMLYAVGAGNQVVAVDKSSDHPPEAPTTDLSGFRPNVEAIGALQPDLVLLARDRDGVVATLEGVGITVVLLEAAANLDEVYEQIETVGAATGHAAEAQQVVADMKADINSLLADGPAQGEPLRYYYELSSEYSTLTSDTFVGSVLELAGLENIADGVAPEAGDYPQLTAEYVLSADPDVVFLAHADGSTPTDDEVAARPGWSDLAAVAEGHIVRLDPGIASRWGPRVVELLEVVLDVTARIGPR